MAGHKVTTADAVVDEHVLALLKKVLQESYDRSETDNVSRTLLLFLVRVANTWRSIRTLRANTDDQAGFMVDAGVLLRAMFDAYLQAEYVVQDAAHQQDRATAYLDFEHIERYKTARRATSHDHPLSERLKSSPNRPEGEKRLLAEYERVKGRYLVEERKRDGAVKRGPATRNKWYPGDLAAIARDLGKEAEYDFFVATFHGCVHSSAFAVHRGPPLSGRYVLHLASTIAARVARLNVSHNHLDLGDSHERLLETLCKDYGEAARSSEKEISEQGPASL